MTFGLKEDDLMKITAVFSLFPEIEKVIIYGSRAKGNFKPSSDIDLSLFGDELDSSILGKIETQLDDLLLPYTFDISIFKHISNFELIDHIKRIGLEFYKRNY